MPAVGSVFGKPLDDDVYGLQNALAIIVSGDTAPSALSPGKYIYLINHSTIRSGLYRIISAIASGDTIVSTDIEVPTDGIINDLIEADDAKVNKTDIVGNLTTNDFTKVLSAAQGYALNSKFSNCLFKDDDSKTSYTIPLVGLRTGAFWLAFMFVGTSASNTGLYVIFMDTSNNVTVSSVSTNIPRTFTGSRSGDNIVITAADAVWGGIRVLMMP